MRNEFDLIKRLTQYTPQGDGVIVGIGDDTAVLQPGPDPLLATKDLLCEGVHFRREWSSPQDIGWKAMAVNLSDIAAMGGRPHWALVGLALPPGEEEAFVEGVYHGISQACQAYGAGLVGGDTSRSTGGLTLSVTLLGSTPRPILRSGGRVGDLLCITGPTGLAAAGLAWLSYGGVGDPPLRALMAHRRPLPQIQAGVAVSPWAHALDDLSDGLGQEVREIAESSGLGAEIHWEDLPKDPQVQAVAKDLGIPLEELLITGGEDFELLVALDPKDLAQAQAALERPLYPIGRLCSEDGVWLVKQGERGPLPRGYQHRWEGSP